MRKIDVSTRWPAKKMDYVPSLRRIPPAEKLHLDPESLQGALGLLNLNLQPAMREQKRVRMVKENLHG